MSLLSYLGREHEGDDPLSRNMSSIQPEEDRAYQRQKRSERLEGVSEGGRRLEGRLRDRLAVIVEKPGIVIHSVVVRQFLAEDRMIRLLFDLVIRMRTEQCCGHRDGVIARRGFLQFIQ